METHSFFGLKCLYLKVSIAGFVSVCDVTPPYRGQQKKIGNHR